MDTVLINDYNFNQTFIVNGAVWTACGTVEIAFRSEMAEWNMPDGGNTRCSDTEYTPLQFWIHDLILSNEDGDLSDDEIPSFVYENLLKDINRKDWSAEISNQLQ